ncbi:unnamed protein product [Lepeophtheirus salmonis]|uniref:(salmon louse) hypothetical protein n=1 Tax=Lepeophtheirus salmonis TaxID=72036 RepID=A0A7R8GZF7_LEPSM|nr:unnamed protein product [Lepeophtheirus salmonis]CAF2752889.1 unnamed protein product [Lepeophtheirus salmonis]
MVKLGLLLFVATVVSGDIIRPNPFSSNSRSSFNQGFNGQSSRQGRQDNSLVSGAVDFRSHPRMYSQERGKVSLHLCDTIHTLSRGGLRRKTFEKICQVTFKQQATEETIKKCYKPLEKVCNGQGPEECRTVYESSCTTKYVEKQPGKFVGDTKCEKLPIEICGAGCVTEEGPQECHDKTITSLIDVLKRLTSPSEPNGVWTPTPAAPGETYDEDNALGAPLG